MDESLLSTAFDSLRARWPEAAPTHALICGSGWSQVAAAFDVKESISYEEIAGFGKPTVVGHSGQVSWGRLGGLETFIFQGRRHYYEGEGWTPVAMPIYLAKRFGVHTMVLTNSAGGIRSDMKAGDLMMLTDHINNMAANPLIGPHLDIWGPRFPDMSSTYATELQTTLASAAKAADIALHEGVYLANSGPTYETPAEVQMAKAMGADAVGMSTVPEAMLANACGMTLAGISCITNLAAGISPHALSHEEVTETTALTMPRMERLLTAFWQEMGEA